MDLLKAKKFEFVSEAVSSDTFGVVNFEGSEGLSSCYQFEIRLVSTEPDIDLEAVLQKPAVFTILRDDGDIPFHGILSEFEQHQAFDQYYFYRAVLVPRFWWLQLTFHNQVFLDKKVADPNDEQNGFLQAVLKDGGLSANDFELRLQKDYPFWEYVCQYQESHYHFTSRWMEREGAYYYFEQTPQGEKLILTDTSLAHTPMPEGRTMYYSPPSGLDETHREEVIQSFVCRQKMLPRKVILKDYNYRTPSLEMKGEADVLDNGRGEVFIYGEHFRTPEEGDALAAVRAEELLCRKRQFIGESTIPFLRPGYVFDLEDHYRDEYNQKYLTTDIHHKGSQTAYLISGIKDVLSEVEEQPYYRNTFTAIPQSVQFRPERTAPPSRFYGTMNARVDAAGSGKYAELDNQGRYKVILPFDLSGRKDGKASAFLRMAQPYAGTDHGMHFPLHKGTEVLLTFIDGNPDRPIVAAAVPNPLNPSPLNSGSQTMAHITTGGQNKIHFEDVEGSQRILFQSPTQNSWIRVGAHNDPATPTLNGDNPMFLYKGETFTDPGAEYDGNAMTTTDKVDNKNPGNYDIEYSYTDADSKTHTISRRVVVVLKQDDVQDYDPTPDGIRIRSDGKFWREAKKRYADYITGVPESPDKGQATVQYLIDKMFNYDGDFKPTGMQAYSYSADYIDTANQPSQDLANYSADKDKWQYLVRNGQVKVAVGDTFNTQEGNIYDFGGYWNYNLGNCYVENHIKQDAALNAHKTYDLLNAGGPDWSGWRSVDIGGWGGGYSKHEMIGGDWTNGKVWVEKKFGETYEYSEGASICVHKGDSQDVKVGGKVVEYNVSNGKLTRKYTSGGGIKHEWKYCRDYGNLLSYETSRQGWGTNNKFGAYFSATSSMSWTFSTSASFAFSLSASFSFAFSAAAKVVIDLNVTQDIKINVPFLTLFSLHVNRGGDTDLVVPGCSIKFKGAGPDLLFKPASTPIEMTGLPKIKSLLMEIKTIGTANLKESKLTCLI